MSELLRRGTEVRAGVRYGDRRVHAHVIGKVCEVAGDRIRVVYPAANGPFPPEELRQWVDRADVERVS